MTTRGFSQEMFVLEDTTQQPEVQIDEIIIKSYKTSEPTFRVPAAISRITAQSINRKEAVSAKELTAIIPNFYMPDYGSKLTSPVYIRGIGSRINSPAVGLYVDNVPYFEKAAFAFDFADIEQVEVLRGPQGTLYGRNTMGGLINIFTRSPKDTNETDLKLTSGNYDTYRALLSHYNAGLKTSWSANAFYNTQGGFFTNEFNQKTADDMESYGGRFKLNHQFSEKFKMKTIASYENSQQNGYPYAIFAKETQTSTQVNYDSPSGYDRDLASGSINLEYQTSKLLINATSSYQYLNDLQEIDQDFTPASLFFVTQEQDINTFSQEVLVKSTTKNRYQWLGGLFAFRQKLDKEVNVMYGEDGVARYKLAGPTAVFKTYDLTTTGYAAYHQSTLNNLFVENLTLIAGIRLDYEKEELIYDDDRQTNDVRNDVSNFDGSRDFFEVLPKVSLNYAANQQLNLFATVARGYKTGGFNSTFERDEDMTFKPEYNWNYEVGAKSKWLKNRLIVNANLFYIDITDQQIYQPVPSGRGSMLTNAGKSESKGVELEIVARPITNLNLHATYGYTEAKFVDYQEKADVNHKGNYIPYVPRQTFHIGADYTWEINKSMADRLSLHLNYQGIDQLYWDEENTAKQDAYGQLNGKLIWTLGKTSVELWGKNLFDTQYNAFYFESLGNAYVQMGKPAQCGINLKYRFN